MQSQIKQLSILLSMGANMRESLKAAGLPYSEFNNPADCYVYALVDPRTDIAFYIGKGQGDRAKQHERAERSGIETNRAKALHIRQLRNCGLKPKILIIAEGLVESEAYRIEGMLIRQAKSRLTNVHFGVRQSAKDRLVLSLRWSQSVFDNCNEKHNGIALEMSRLCQQLIQSVSRMDEDAIAVQEVDLVREKTQNSLIIKKMLGVDQRLTKQGV